MRQRPVAETGHDALCESRLSNARAPLPCWRRAFLVFVELLAQRFLGSLQNAFVPRREVRAGPVDVESQHRHGGTVWTRLAPFAAFGRALEGGGDLPGIAAFENSPLKVQRFGFLRRRAGPSSFGTRIFCFLRFSNSHGRLKNVHLRFLPADQMSIFSPNRLIYRRPAKISASSVEQQRHLGKLVHRSMTARRRVALSETRCAANLVGNRGHKDCEIGNEGQRT